MPLIELDNNIQINYLLEGNEEGDLLLLIHGYGSWLWDYDYIVPLLKDRFLILRSDLRGHGDSDKPLEGDYESSRKLYTIEQFAEDNYLLVKKLGLLNKHEKIFIYGHSMGGMISLVFALKYPNVVNKLILGSTAPYMRNELTENLLRDYKTGKTTPTRENFAKTASIGFTYRFSKKNPEELEKGVEAKLKCPPEVIIGALENFVKDYDVREKIKGIKVPTLILTCDKDRLINYKEGSLIIHDQIPNSKLVVFKRQNHGINKEIPETVVKEIVNFCGNKKSNS